MFKIGCMAMAGLTPEPINIIGFSKCSMSNDQRACCPYTKSELQICEIITLTIPNLVRALSFDPDKNNGEDPESAVGREHEDRPSPCNTYWN